MSRPAIALPRLTIVVGKGGVGRSTLAAAMGLVLARRGLRTMVVEVAGRQTVPAMFGTEPRGYEPVKCSDLLWTMQVTWEDALREYGLMKLYFRAAYRMVFENAFARRLLPAIPGLAEILVIGKVLYLATDGAPGLGRVDAVVLDAPATGHGVSLLAAPMVVSDTVPSGPLAEDARRLKALLLDTAFTRLHIVTTPEEMPVAESVELFDALGRTYGLPFGPVLVNGVQARSLRPAQREALDLLCRGRSDSVAAAAQGAMFMAARHDMQRSHLTRLARHVPLPLVKLPDVPGARSPRDRLDVLAGHLDSRMWREGR